MGSGFDPPLRSFRGPIRGVRPALEMRGAAVPDVRLYYNDYDIESDYATAMPLLWDDNLPEGARVSGRDGLVVGS